MRGALARAVCVDLLAPVLVRAHLCERVACWPLEAPTRQYRQHLLRRVQREFSDQVLVTATGNT
jgi:hypothetical protein